MTDHAAILNEIREDSLNTEGPDLSISDDLTGFAKVREQIGAFFRTVFVHVMYAGASDADQIAMERAGLAEPTGRKVDHTPTVEGDIVYGESGTPELDPNYEDDSIALDYEEVH